jgi:hypothetical protein
MGNKKKYYNNGRGFRLDKLLNHFNAIHKNGLIDNNAKTLFDVGFHREDGGATGGEDDGVATADGVTPHTIPQVLDNGTTQLSIIIPAASAEIILDCLGQQLWRLFRHQMDAIIKPNAADKVIPSAKVIA